MKYWLSFLLLFCVLSASAQKEAVQPTDEFTVKGLVSHEFTFRIKDLAQYRQERLGDVVIRNHKGEQKGMAKNMSGIRLKDILDKAGIHADKPKEYSEFYIVLTASDGYKNVYSWNELFNSDIGDHIYVITGEDGMAMDQMPDRILVLSTGDYNSGRRHLKGLADVEVRKVE